jgi:hypothetical protein
MNKKHFLLLLILVSLALLALPQGNNKGSKGQQYILLDTLKDNRKPLYQRHYTYNQLKRKGYSPVKYKGGRCMNWKWYLELTTTKK